MKTYKIFTLKLAHHLTQNGFRCLGKLPNKEKPYLWVYEFEDTPEMRACMETYRKPQ